jgi:hypothetical protein
MGGTGSFMRQNRTIYGTYKKENKQFASRLSRNDSGRLEQHITLVDILIFMETLTNWTSMTQSDEYTLQTSEFHRRFHHRFHHYFGGINAYTIISIEEIVARHFAEFGSVERIRVLNTRGVAFITYSNEGMSLRHSSQLFRLIVSEATRNRLRLYTNSVMLTLIV